MKNFGYRLLTLLVVALVWVWFGLCAMYGEPLHTEVAPVEGWATFYSEEHRGDPMADRGRPFNPDALTCASWYYPFGTILQVTSGRWSVFVVVTDRGPRADRVQQGAIIDLSRRAFELLGDKRLGWLPVKIRRVQ